MAQFSFINVCTDGDLLPIFEGMAIEQKQEVFITCPTPNNNINSDDILIPIINWLTSYNFKGMLILPGWCHWKKTLLALEIVQKVQLDQYHGDLFE